MGKKFPKLMIPGPVELDDSVLKVLGTQVTPHFGEEFASSYKNIIQDIKTIFGTDGKSFLLVCSGTGGIEASIRNLFPPNKHVLVLRNGFFGERISQIALAANLIVETIDYSWEEPIPADLVREKIKSMKSVEGLIAVHHETSTGQLNPIEDYGNITKEIGIPLIADMVSSLGSEKIEMDNWGVDISISVSNKCLEGPAGVSLVAIGEQAWENIKSINSSQAGWYTNFQVWQEYFDKWNDWHPYPITMPTSIILGLREALNRLRNETIEGRHNRYLQAAHYLRDALTNLDIHGFGNPISKSCSISAFVCPEKIDASNLIEYIKKNNQIYIAGGLGKLRNKVFRVSHMGKASDKSYNDELILSISEYLK